ncbi:unnamed protein product [Schistosoma spindalis]|nr:unnamed protein product [Schistosoma spindale]
MIISSIIIWIKSSCNEKFSPINKTECNPIIITTKRTKDQSLRKLYWINCLSTNKKYQYSSKIDNNNNNTNNNNRLNWPVTNIIHQSINDRNIYSTHDSINDNLNVNTTTNTTIITTNQDLFSYANHLHTTPICSFPFPYDNSNHSDKNNNNDDYDDH